MKATGNKEASNPSALVYLIRLFCLLIPVLSEMTCNGTAFTPPCRQAERQSEFRLPYFSLLLLDGDILIQVCGSQRTVHLGDKEKIYISCKSCKELEGKYSC